MGRKNGDRRETAHMSGGRTTGAVAVVLAFNEAINRRDITELGQLMTVTHRFIDSAGTTVQGREACLVAWRGFFESFPDYRNVFEDLTEVEPGVVAVSGHSECSFTPLDGPAEWRAVVHDGRVDVWRVDEPASDT